jgi:hypothetical protein
MKMNKPNFKESLESSLSDLMNDTKTFIFKIELPYLIELHKANANLLPSQTRKKLISGIEQLLEKAFKDLQYNIEGAIEECICDFEFDFESSWLGNSIPKTLVDGDEIDEIDY